MKIQLNSGFRRGAWVSQWDGKDFVMIARASENTYHDDGDSSKEVVVDDGFKGAVVEFHGVSTVTYVNSIRLVGFSEEELNGPSPEVGWHLVTSGQSAKKCERVKNFGDWLVAAADSSFIPVPTNGNIHRVSRNRLVELPYEWGNQAASHYVMISPEGEIIREECGCGDNTPIVLNWSMDWEFTSKSLETQKEHDRFNCALDSGSSQEWLPILRYLRASYSVPINPLKGLRKKYPGTWTYYELGQWPRDIADGDVIFNENDPQDWEAMGSGWRVIYSPTKK
jgi:hypothetical protein